ncbi:MAG: AMP-dependent synthetase/ligase [Terriglobia bacterium]
MTRANDPVETGNFETLNELFLRAAVKRAKPDAFLSKNQGRYQGLSSMAALRLAAALGLALEGFGVRPGDRVALLSENREEWALSDYAIMGIGAIDVPLYPTLPASEIEFIMRHSEARGIILSTPDQLRKIIAIKDGLPGLEFVIVMDLAQGATPDIQSFQRVIQDQLSRAPTPEKDFSGRALKAKPQDTATIIYTSGTTGQAKGVVLTHANIVSNIKACMPLFKFTPADRLLSFLPLSHILERMIEYFAFWSGASIAYAESFDALPKNMIEVRPTIMAVVPRVLEKAHAKALETVRQGSPARQKLFHWAHRTGWAYASCCLENRHAPVGLRVRHSIADSLVGAKIRARFGGKIKYLISGSAPLSREIAAFFHAMGLPVYEGYGLTETSPVVAVNYPGAIRLGSVGPVLGEVEVKLGEEPESEEGKEGREILVRGANVSPGYYKQEAETQTAFRDGWFYTGDLGKIDAEGYLSITGRKKNLLKTSGGKYVSPEKIESLFQGHPYVRQMIVLGDKRHFVAALVVPDFQCIEALARQQGLSFESRGKLVELPQICGFMQHQVDEVCRVLAPYEQIRQIALLAQEFSIESGELSPSLKVKRFIVEERYRELIDAIYRRKRV